MGDVRKTTAAGGFHQPVPALGLRGGLATAPEQRRLTQLIHLQTALGRAVGVPRGLFPFDAPMIDHAKESLKHITESGDYVALRDVPIFDEHEEQYTAKGKDGKPEKVVETFDYDRLCRMAAKGNAREKATGDLSPLGPGHTDDDGPEESQPPIWGYQRNYRVARVGPARKWHIVVDWFVKKWIKTRDGRTVYGPDYVKEFPRRSVEIWRRDNLIDWVALLRRTPERDLGLLAYARSGEKLRYSMESHMDLENDAGAPPASTDPTLPPDASVDIDEPMPPEAQDMPDEDKERFSKGLFGMPHKHLHSLVSHLHKKYAKECGIEEGMGGEVGEPSRYDAASLASAPSATNAFIPGEKEEPKRMSKPTTDTSLAPSRYQREVADLKKEKDALAKRLADLEGRERAARYSKELSDLAHEGYEFDVAEELADCQELDADAFAKHKQRIVKRYAKAPVGGDLVRFSREREFPAGTDGVSHELANKAKSLATRKGIDFDAALAELRPAK